ncbi:amidohydrolase family protein [Streptomyces sp. NPDC093085]|uniref:amidohydrolase family protein n=1 Tax=Streptomyces sp. NPDC093085 TaxID=3155068 RepID=UPI00343B5E21
MTTSRVLLKDGIVLSMDDAIGDFSTGDILIEDGRIVSVGPGLAADARTVDCRGKIVIPGFVNSHIHMFQTALRSYWSDALAADYFRQSREGAGAILHHYTPEDVYWSMLAAGLECLGAGITTVVDTSQSSYTPMHSDAAIDGLIDSGIRGVFALSSTSGDNVPDPAYAYPHDIHRIVGQRLTSDDALVTPALGFLLDREVVRLARDLGLPYYAHINNAETGHLLETLAEEGLTGPRHTYIHCLGLADSTWETIARAGAHVSISCIVEQTLGMGWTAMQSALDHGIRPAFSTDAVSLGPVDFFTQTRSALLLQRSRRHEREFVGGSPVPPALDAYDMLRMATVEGARAAHLEHKVGSLTPGKRADVVVLDARRLNAWPVHHAAGTVVQFMDTSNVDSVLVDGRFVKENGRLVGVDEAKIFDELTRSAAGLFERSNYPSVLLTSCRSEG